MLYNVLPPLIFFMSLGGAILVVSRVVLRVRRDQVASELQSHVTQVSKNRLNKIQDLAGILAPNQISVHNFKNRISYLGHTAKNSITKLVTDVKGWRTSRAERKQQVKVEKMTNSPDITVENSDTSPAEPEIESIKQPTSRFRGSIKKIASQAKEVSTKSHIALRKYAVEAAGSIKSRKTKAKDIIEASEQESTEKDMYVRPKEPTAGISRKPIIRLVDKNEKIESSEKESIKPQVKEEQYKTAKISKFFKKDHNRDHNKNVLEQAKDALANAQIQKVEDILVPYIIKHPKNTSAYMMLGKAAINRKNWTEATEIFEQVSRIKPDTKGCYASLGRAAYESGNLTKAIEALQRAHDQSPKNVHVIQRLIKIASRLDNQPMQRSLTEELEALKKNKSQESQAV